MNLLYLVCEAYGCLSSTNQISRVTCRGRKVEYMGSDLLIAAVMLVMGSFSLRDRESPLEPGVGSRPRSTGITPNAIFCLFHSTMLFGQDDKSGDRLVLNVPSLKIIISAIFSLQRNAAYYLIHLAVYILFLCVREKLRKVVYHAKKHVQADQSGSRFNVR